MKTIVIKPERIPSEQIPEILKEHGILINHYAEEYFSHPRFSAGLSEERSVAVASLQEIGLDNGGTLQEIFRHIAKMGFKPCDVSTGVFLRLAWRDQPQSSDSVLSGTHSSPDQAVTVLSEIIDPDDSFPKGLYLRNVDGSLWLRGYICDDSYRFDGSALFAFENITENT